MRELHEHRYALEQYRHCAGEFAALDFQPIVFIPGGEIQPLHIDLPPALIAAMRDEAEAVTRLSNELYQCEEAMRRDQVYYSYQGA